MHVLVGDLQGNQELGSVSLSLQVGEAAKEPVEDVLEGAFLPVDNIAAVVGVEVTGVAKDFEEAANTLLGLFLRLFLHVYGLMSVIQMRENAID